MQSPLVIHQGAEFILRRFAPSDAEGVLDAVVESGEDLSRFETWARPPFSIGNAEEYVGWWTEGWASRTAFFFAIVDGDELVGACGIYGIQPNRSASIGYWVRTTATGKGIATAAARSVARWGFETLHLERIDLKVSNSNPASVRVAEKLHAGLVGGHEGGLPLTPEDANTFIYRLHAPSDAS